MIFVQIDEENGNFFLPVFVMIDKGVDGYETDYQPVVGGCFAADRLRRAERGKSDCRNRRRNRKTDGNRGKREVFPVGH